MAASKVTQGKEKDFDSIVPRFSYCDMQEDIRKQVVDVCRDAYKRQHDGEFKYFKDLAMHVKKSLDNDLKDDMGQRTLDGAWHVVVGKFATGLTLCLCVCVFRYELRKLRVV